MRPTRRDTGLVAIGAVVSGGAGFGFTWLLARASGASGAGIVLTVTTWFTILLTLAKAGMDTTLVREGGRIRAGETGVDPVPLLRWTLWPVAAVSAAPGAVIALAADPIGKWILADSPVSLTPIVVTAGLLLPLAVYTMLQLAFLRGLGSIASYVLIEQVLKPGLRLLGAAVLLFFGVRAAMAYGYAWFLPVFVGATLTSLIANRARQSWGEGSGENGERARVWGYARPRAASQVVDIANVSFGTVTLGVLSTPAETGTFATALRVVMAGQLAFQAVRLLIAPSLAALLASARHRDAQEVFATGTSLIVVLAWPAFLICLVFPDLVLGLFGAGFEGASVTLQILSLSGLLLAVVGNQGSVVLMSGRSRSALWAVSCGLAANLVLTLSLVRAWGSNAAALGWTASVAVEGIYLALVLHREGFRPLPRESMLMASRLLLTLGAGLVLAKAASGHGWLSLTLAVVGFLAAIVWAGPHAAREFHTLTRGEIRG